MPCTLDAYLKIKKKQWLAESTRHQYATSKNKAVVRANLPRLIQETNIDTTFIHLRIVYARLELLQRYIEQRGERARTGQCTPKASFRLFLFFFFKRKGINKPRPIILALGAASYLHRYFSWHWIQSLV